ncbi:Cof-type HAD-IIB family hydrolase [Periweissella cryptocerci]|uniref:Cof-type HAD-IIB family hydrolase n=1 Tax=Periweissella cryptocerci TaxID=2506420 RepID=A0A4V1AIM9_9LACO|nr:Cof-type HAD-IIB family hydrolase [Periweissella cryptocerci]QBO36065.1 Cof-type HAD-IIB family hydrolase [Periweissella cryptocerci]
MYKAIVFFDLDGTLYSANHRSVSPENVQAIQQLRANNILPVINTGRNLADISEARQVTGITDIISENGASIMHDNQRIIQHAIPTPVIKALSRFAAAHNNPLALCDDDNTMLTAVDEWTEKQYHETDVAYNPEAYKHMPISMIMTFTPAVAELDLQVEYEAVFGDQLHFYRNSPFALDTVTIEADKATGMTEFINELGLAGAPTYAFGDGVNDLPVLRQADHAIVMGNGLAEVKAEAEYVTSSNLEGGIVEGLKQFGLI